MLAMSHPVKDPARLGFVFSLLVLLPTLAFAPRAAASTWEKSYSWDYNEEGISIVQAPDGGFVIAGTTHSFGPGAPDLGNPYLMKLDADGNMLWFHAYGTPLDEYMHGLALTPDGGYITCGLQSSQDWTSSTFYVIKTDGQGQLQWERTYGPTGYQSCAFSITPVKSAMVVMA